MQNELQTLRDKMAQMESEWASAKPLREEPKLPNRP